LPWFNPSAKQAGSRWTANSFSFLEVDEAAVLLDAKVEAAAEGVGLHVDVRRPGLDVVDQRDGDGLVFRMLVFVGTGELVLKLERLTSTTPSTARRTVAIGSPTKGTLVRMPDLPIKMLSRTWWTRTN
jgi:hypothetical protein